MRNTLGMLLMSGTLLAGTVQATEAKGFKGVTLATLAFQALNLFTHWVLTRSTANTSHEPHMRILSHAHLRTHATSHPDDQDNTRKPAGSTDWRTPPDASVI